MATGSATVYANPPEGSRREDHIDYAVVVRGQVDRIDAHEGPSEDSLNGLEVSADSSNTPEPPRRRQYQALSVETLTGPTDDDYCQLDGRLNKDDQCGGSPPQLGQDTLAENGGRNASETSKTSTARRPSVGKFVLAFCVLVSASSLLVCGVALIGSSTSSANASSTAVLVLQSLKLSSTDHETEIQNVRESAQNVTAYALQNKDILGKRCHGVAAWKQYTWRNWEDNRDSQVLRSVTYLKKQNDAALRVTFHSTLTVSTSHNGQADNKGCSKWYLQFDGQDCTSPAPIVSTIFVLNFNGWYVFPADIGGICTATSRGRFSPGNVNITVSVTPCEDMGGDSHTGRSTGNTTSYLLVEEYCQ